MENKKNLISKPIYNRETAPELTLKAPPPTPCMSLQQRSGSVPDIRVVDEKREKIHSRSPTPMPTRLVPIDFYWKKSSSEHAIFLGTVRPNNRAGFRMGPCTSNLLHSVRQRLLNL